MRKPKDPNSKTSPKDRTRLAIAMALPLVIGLIIGAIIWYFTGGGN